jgi:hypothetical protein
MRMPPFEQILCRQRSGERTLARERQRDMALTRCTRQASVRDRESALVNDTAATGKPCYRWWRVASWSAIALLLSLPAVLRFPWSLSDFAIMGLLLGSVGLGIDFLVRQSSRVSVRLGSIVAVLTGLLTIWVNLSVGMIGDDDAYNLLFLLPPFLVLVGGIVVRVEPLSMARLCLAAAVLQAAIGLAGYGMDPRGAVVSGSFGLLWFLGATLFRLGAKAPDVTGDSRS